MQFHDRLLSSTAEARAALIAAPIIQRTLRGEVFAASYIAFLTEAYHHVSHTVPLLAACKAKLPERLAWMAPELDQYIAEESGHDQWILDDIAACGGDAEAVRNGRPQPATELMVAYAYDTIARGNPLGFFGMVLVLEGTSVALALQAADHIQRALRLPDSALSYLRSHGELDREHTAHFARLMNLLDDPADQQAVIHAATMFYRLYGDVFRGLPLPAASHVLREVAAVSAHGRRKRECRSAQRAGSPVNGALPRRRQSSLLARLAGTGDGAGHALRPACAPLGAQPARAKEAH